MRTTSNLTTLAVACCVDAARPAANAVAHNSCCLVMVSSREGACACVHLGKRWGAVGPSCSSKLYSTSGYSGSHLRCGISVAGSFDLLVAAQQNRWRHRKTERLGSPKVQDHLELGRELHRKIARLIAAQDAIDISGGAAKAVYHAVSVGEPASQVRACG